MRVISRVGITPVGSPHYRLNRLRLHILAYSLVRHAQLTGREGLFIARCDDTNKANLDRSYLDSYLQTLKEIGVNFAKTPYAKDQNGHSLFQSQRSEIYSQKLEELRTKGLVLEDSTGAAFFNTQAFAVQYEELFEGYKLGITDLILGKLEIDIRSSNRGGEPQSTQPFAIRRSDGTYLFNFTSPVDDGEMGVTHLVRDRSKFNLVARQEMVRIALGFPQIRYLHAPILVNNEGKRFVSDPYLGEATYENLRESGFSSKAIISYLLASIGGPPEKFHKSIDSFASGVNFAKLHSSNTRFSLEVLRTHQSASIREMDDQTYSAELLKIAKARNPAYAERLASDPELLGVYVRRRSPLNDLTKIESIDIDNCVELAGDTDSFSDAQLIYNLFKGQLTGVAFGDLFSDAPKYQAVLAMEKKRYYSALRLMLTGKTEGPSLSEVVRYYESKGQLGNRIASFELRISKKKKGKTNRREFI